ncbi:hypothetical protein [Asticcacaulis solisilvae]|uniref:hypothetical protein n=1 Tax=Asticcacaulis solisilvae TaxID=1217274 RepID=UPI003FD75E33
MTAPYRTRDNRLNWRLSWDRVDPVPERDLKLILGEGDFRRLYGPHGAAPQGYYRGSDRNGNSIAIRVIPDAIAA